MNATQTSLIPGEEDLKKLCGERSELRSKVKPLLDLIKGNAQFLVKYAPFCHDVFFRSEHLIAAASNTAIAIDQASELSKATMKLGDCLIRYGQVEQEIEHLKEHLNRETNGEYRRKHPYLWDESPEQLDKEADAILEANGLDAETAEPTERAAEVEGDGVPLTTSLREAFDEAGIPTDEDGVLPPTAEDMNPASAI